MKFSWKIFVSTFLIVLLSLAAGGYFLVASSFSSSLNREIVSAGEENRMLQLMLAVNLSNSEDNGIGEDALIRDSLKNMDAGMGGSLILYRVSSGKKETIYENAGLSLRKIDAKKELIISLEENETGHAIRRYEELYLIQTASMLYFEEEAVYVETFRDVSELFRERTEQFDLFRTMILVVGSISGIVNFFMALWLTDPVMKLSGVTRRFAGGDLKARAKIRTEDEIGLLAEDFNDMADRIEADIEELTFTARRQEDFIGSFAHELKTPLTSIIGYADMLRSSQLDEEHRFLAASYIFTEGKRLEGLSLKLLDLMLLRNEEIVLKPVSAMLLLGEIERTMRPVLKKEEIRLKIKAEEGIFAGDKDLIETVLLNIVDNGRKAIDGGGTIVIIGKAEKGGYAFYVRDTGKGIPKEEIDRITEAFYMVDKSRSREKGGAGLGLAICQEIVTLHHGIMEFSSVLGEGTMVRIVLPYSRKEGQKK